MFGLALFAASRPPHDDWLNEWSSTPPTSSTMHALRLPAAAVSELVGVESDGWSVAVLELGFEQPATSRLAAPMAATILSGWRKWVSSFVPPPAERGKWRAHPNARRRLRRLHPSGFSDVLHNSDPEGPGDVAGPFQRPG